MTDRYTFLNFISTAILKPPNVTKIKRTKSIVRTASLKLHIANIDCTLFSMLMINMKYVRAQNIETLRKLAQRKFFVRNEIARMNRSIVNACQ